MNSRIISLSILFLILLPMKVHGQLSQLDSVIFNNDFIVLDGKVPTYYSHGHRDCAINMQSILSDILETYSLDDIDAFKIKLAVLDSSTYSEMPSLYRLQYGLFSVREDWIIIPADLNHQNAPKVYGFEDLKSKVVQNLDVVSKTLKDAIDASYIFQVSHELGHLYTLNGIDALPPDRWTDELMANYFAYDYLYKKYPEALKSYIIITETFAFEYNPLFRSISDFNLRYSGMGVKNYAWYQTMQIQMVEEIYLNCKSDFLGLFAKTFPQVNVEEQILPEEIHKSLDDLTGGVYSKWIEIIENTSNQ